MSWTIAAQISLTYQSASAAFTGGDVGKVLAGTDLITGTTIQSVTDSTHCVLSQSPTAAGTGLSWSIINTIPGSGGAPTVTRIVTGDSTHQETQQVSFSEYPQFGSFTLQDGSGGQPITPDISLPLDPGEIQSSLNATYLANTPFLVTMIQPTIFQIQWGVIGSQSLILVSDTKTIYDNVVLRLILVPGSGVSVSPSLEPKTVYYDGNFAAAIPCGAIRTESIPNSGGAIRVMQRFNQLGRNFRALALNSGGPFGSLLIDELGSTDVGGGIVEWDRVYATVPPGRTDQIWGGRTYQGLAKTFTNGVLTDQQIWSISVSNMLTRHRIFTAGYPNWHFGGTPSGIIIHYTNGQSVLLGFNGFNLTLGTFFASWVWTVDITRYMGDIWQMDWVIG